MGLEYKQILYDGQKATTLRNLPEEAWKYISGGDQADAKLQKAFSSVPWLFRATAIRSSVISRVPFAIMDGDNELDTSKNYQNKLGFMPNPRALLGRIESSLTLLNRAYLFREYNNRRTLNLRYLLPDSVKPVINSEMGLTGFERWIKGKKREFTTDDIVYFWDYSLDPFTESGAPQASAGTAALAAAGVIMNIDQFASLFFERGAIKSTILSVPKGTQKAEREKLGNWWEKVISGVKNAWGAYVMNADDVKPVVIGEGVKELSNIELTKEKREDIATALGVPHSLLFSNAATFATARQDDIHMHNKVVIHDIELIQEALNTQLLDPLGLRWEFRPEAMEIFQEEEVKRSAAFVNYVRGDIPPTVVMEILGIDLPPAMDEAQLEEKILAWMEKKAAFRPTFGSNGGGGNFDPNSEPADPTASSSDGIRSMLDTWERHALKAQKEGKHIKGTASGQPFDHEGKLDPGLVSAIGGSLNAAKSSADIERIFRDARTWEDYP